MMMITDGAPTDPPNVWQEAARRIQDAENNRKLSCFCVAVEGADINTLKKIAPSNRPPVQLKGLQFSEMFSWLSASVSRVSTSNFGDTQVALDPIGWGFAPTN